MSEYSDAWAHVSRLAVAEMCDADFRPTGMSQRWTESFWITPDGVVYQYGVTSI
jgi:hypothetical protein